MKKLFPADLEWSMLDAPNVKCHPHAAGMIPVIPPKKTVKSNTSMIKICTSTDILWRICFCISLDLEE